MNENELLFLLICFFFMGMAFDRLLVLIWRTKREIRDLRAPVNFHFKEDKHPLRFNHDRGQWSFTEDLACGKLLYQEQPGDVGHDPQRDPGLKS